MFKSKSKLYLLSLIITSYMIFFFTVPGICGMVGSSFQKSDIKLSQKERTEKIEVIQRALENKMVQAKLKTYNLDDKEIIQKLQNSSDAQIHMLAQASEKVLAGGDSLGLLITVLVIIILVVLILRLA